LVQIEYLSASEKSRNRHCESNHATTTEVDPFVPTACADVRMRTDIQSAPPPDRDQCRRRAFMLEDVEDEFVTSDLAQRR